jgi:hypothetical protein
MGTAMVNERPSAWVATVLLIDGTVSYELKYSW